ncbi:hypothetical protein ACFQ4Q_10215 [Lysobacter gummosus]|uniref:hypothetical protein n=1 Tax=Lysobacter gummosus TaxID=262324 RepID=UPI003630E40A
MPKKRFSSEEIIHKLREAEVLSAQGRTIAEICSIPCVLHSKEATSEGDAKASTSLGIWPRCRSPMINI